MECLIYNEIFIWSIMWKISTFNVDNFLHCFSGKNTQVNGKAILLIVSIFCWALFYNMHVRFFWLFRKKSTNQLIFVKKGKPTFVEPLKIYSLNFKYVKTPRGGLSFVPPSISLLFLNIYFEIYFSKNINYNILIFKPCIQRSSAS